MGYFQFFTTNRPQNHQKGAILHTSQANVLEPLLPPPAGYATGADGDFMSTKFGYADYVTTTLEAKKCQKGQV